ncbi:YadA-like family protein [Veillonella sp. oral taxon 158]|uniref:YadA-like family protein n=1 Tax=Veillonella sp. oral taxon 158 TaxID=671228 RepID=UPI0001EB46C1|nr:YadA-like family protein [Veillonella sp. oral taxon 158]EFR61015.1 hemagglutinin [Veillonella sp. oral taxon 158 str. F0412]
MNKIFKVVWSASKQCYVVASEIATNTSGKKKIIVATVLAALAMGGSLQVGAETVVTADKINTGVLTLDNATFKSEGNSETTIQSDAIRMSGGGTDWKTEILPGFVGIETDEYTAMLSAEGTYIGEVNGGAGTLILPNGLTVNKSNDKELTYTLDKVSVGGNKIENVAEGTEDSDAVNLKQLKSYVNATDKDTHSTVTAGENVEVNTSTNSDNTTNYEVKLKKDLTGVNSISLEDRMGYKTIKINGNDGSIKAGNLDVNNIEARSITFDGEDIVTKLDRNEFSMIGNDISGIPWKTILNPGLIAVETSETNTYISRHGFNISDVDETAETLIEPKGLTLANKDGKVLEFNLDKISAGGMKIQDVAEGTADTDAVNVKQLKDSISNISNVAVDAADIKLGYKADGANAQTTSLKDGLNFKSGELTTATVGENGEVTYNVKTSTLTIDGKGTVKGEAGVATSDNVAKVINQVVQQTSSDTKELKQAISNVSTESQRVGAHAAAMAALKPIQYDPMEPTQVMAGIGNYRGETAAALGLAHYTNENTMLNVGVSLGGTHNMVNAGVTHKFGSSPEKKNIPERYKGGPISSIYVMQDEMTRMQAKNDAQQVEIEQQRAEIESLKSMVQQLLAKH